jgi:hypothetical protein
LEPGASLLLHDSFFAPIARNSSRLRSSLET